MNLEELRSWILSEDGLAGELRLLYRYTAAKSIGTLATLNEQLQQYQPDWKRLLLAGSILSTSRRPDAGEYALAIAQAGLLHSSDHLTVDASATVMTQLANHRAVHLAERRELLRTGLEERVGTTEQMLLTRRELEQSIFPVHGQPLTANRFQRDFWNELGRAEWVSASAPTASGKTYLVLQWLLNEFSSTGAKLAVFIAPTRALVGEVERELLDLAPGHKIDNLRIASLPLAALGDRTRPTILVFTQERLHVFLNSLKHQAQIDIAVVDEAQKIGDGLRGVVLQDAVERVSRANPKARVIFLSPLTENPETLLDDAPAGSDTAVVPNDTPTVTQNLLIAEQLPRHSDQWLLSLRKEGRTDSLGSIRLHAKPDTASKRLSYVALALGKLQPGTLVYANGAADAEKIAWQIYGGLGAESPVIDDDLKSLSDFARDTVHPQFQLVTLLRKGVAFHYGNMPTLLRAEIERLFKEGKIRFLVCTSTLVEGVNLACRTIVIRGPRKGKKTAMGPHDFWNLAGRAGRWGQDFSGNIVCVDASMPTLWPSGVPERARYPINRETDAVLMRHESMMEYLNSRVGKPTDKIDPRLEHVAAYLMAWRARSGTFLNAPSAARLSPAHAQDLDQQLGLLLKDISIPDEIISRHPGVSAVALQSLLAYFRDRKEPVEELLPSSPESSDAYSQLVAIFHRINKHLYLAFFPSAAIPVHALVTIEWLRGLPLAQIIQRRVSYLKKNNRPFKLPAVIRDTMRDVEEVARFRAPKYLAAYLDVLRHYLDEIGQADLLPDDLNFDLYLEFGVATETLLSLIGLGISRTSAVAINEYLADDKMTEDRVLDWLRAETWKTLDIPAVIRRELDQVTTRRTRIANA